MFEEQNQEQVAEETLEVVEKIDSEKVSVENAPAPQAENVAEIKDYLSTELFSEVRVVNQSELIDGREDNEVDNELEQKYSSTFGDISEHSLIQGRVVGMNERDVLIDIGFKSEGIIDRSEFNED